MKLSELIRKLQAQCECADEEVVEYRIVVGTAEDAMVLRDSDKQDIGIADVGKVEDVLGDIIK